MSQRDDRRDKTLPITAEVGGEGGSFADATSQVSTFNDDIRRTDGRGGISAIASSASRMDPEESAVGNPEGGGMVRYPTEPPSPPSATEGWRSGHTQWRTAVLGAAAGAALALGISRLRRPRTADDRGPGGFGSGASDE